MTDENVLLNVGALQQLGQNQRFVVHIAQRPGQADRGGTSITETAVDQCAAAGPPREP